jgi:hypothetical protein
MLTADPVFRRVEEVSVLKSAAAMRAATAAAAVAATAAPVGGAGTAAPVAAAALAAPSLDVLQDRWAQWVSFINSGGKAEFPSYLAKTTQIWQWILQQFATAPGVKEIAYQWWIDKIPTYTERRGILEYLLSIRGTTTGRSAPLQALQTALLSDMFQSTTVIGYRIFNMDTDEVEYWCRPTEAGSAFSPCSTAIAAAVGKALGNKPTVIPDETGSLMGFLVPKGTAGLVFKTLDMEKMAGAKRKSLVGAECGNVSNLGEHQPRVRILHAASRTVATLAPMIIPDDDASWDDTGKATRMLTLEIAHMKDITHQPLCIYMEFLTRLLDRMRVGGRRWFLSAVEAAQSGLKGKK